ncbi:MAG: transposase [Bacillota bacterium]|nr:transposase [Bacillota bacterium]
MSGKSIKFVMVNPHHVHKSKELDDNSPSKNDCKDPRIIAGLVREGRYYYTYMPRGIYAELRNASNRRFTLVEEQTRIKNRLYRWISVYFPEYKGIYRQINAKGGLLILKEAPIPEDVIKLGIDGIIEIWKREKLRANGRKKAIRMHSKRLILAKKERHLTDREAAVQMTVYCNNLFFGKAGSNELSWSRWIFPVINTIASLKEMDHYAQEAIRYVYCGSFSAKRYRLRYRDIQKMGYRSLVHEYYHFER